MPTYSITAPEKAFGPATMEHIGIDVHKKEGQICIVMERHYDLPHFWSA